MNPSKSQVYEERYLTHAQIQDALDECAKKGEPGSVLFVMRELFNKGHGTAVRPVVSGASTFEETIALTPLLESMTKKCSCPSLDVKTCVIPCSFPRHRSVSARGFLIITLSRSTPMTVSMSIMYGMENA